MRQLAGFGRQGKFALLCFVGPICLSAKETALKVACAGEMPLSGYLVMPINAIEKSLAAEVASQGYGVKSARKNIDSGRDKIFFVINAHGTANGQPAEYYQKLVKGKYRADGFSDEKNSKRQASFFDECISVSGRLWNT